MLTERDVSKRDEIRYSSETGLPLNPFYLEKGLPPYLKKSIEAMVYSWEIEDSGQQDIHWDVRWSELNADINAAEVEQEISHRQAQHLRKKYLRLEKVN